MGKLFVATHDQDVAIMSDLVRFTARSFTTSSPVPFGAAVVHTKSGKLLLRARNAVMRENDPSSHAELRTVRLACKKVGKPSLAGYTLYSTCEPCPMCMANALWARLDRVVFGATIEDANRHCNQIQISAEEVSRRSDMPCRVDAQVLRDECYSLFTDPRMLKAFKKWSTRKA
jgi:tRNA(Arg) A34 adenosine deaminase TadA